MVEFAVCILNASKFLINSTIFLNNNEDDDSDEELIEIHINLLKNRLQYENEKLSRCRNFMEITIPNSSAKEFQSHFRVTLEAFERLNELLTPILKREFVVGRDRVECRRQLLSVLWLLATPECYRSVGNRFDMCKSTLFASFERVINALMSIAPQIIKWPTRDEARQIERRFYGCASLRGVIGAIDGTYVKIKAPKENPETYINRKCFHAITLPAIAIPSLLFTNCFTGYPSSVSDVRIFRNSDVYVDILNNNEQYFDNDMYIIGDKAYPVFSWCIPPYIDRGRLLNYQRNFNTVHAKTRQIVERSFALLFGRFRRLRDLDMSRMDLIPKTIIACCVLHNICLNFVDANIELYINEGQCIVDGDNNDNLGNIQNVNQERIEGMAKRDRIARDMYNRRANNV